jgi:predicted nucleic acid-binding protein
VSADYSSNRRASRLRRDWRTKGQTLSFTDETIAAIALANQTPLLTDNQKHFPEEGLELWPLPAHGQAR